MPAESREILIRPMAPAHYATCAALWRATPGMGLNPVDDSREGILRYLARNPGTCFVALQGGVLVGTILAGHDGRRGVLYHACVAESARGLGLGRRLASAALAALRAEGITKAMLLCLRNNACGNAFWQHTGWQQRDDLHTYSLPLRPGAEG